MSHIYVAIHRSLGVELSLNKIIVQYILMVSGLTFTFTYMQLFVRNEEYIIGGYLLLSLAFGYGIFHMYTPLAI